MKQEAMQIRKLGNSICSMKRCALYLALVLLSATAFADSQESFDWPQWQGPDRDATSKETGLLKEWPKEGPPLAWKVTGLGGGDSAPSIAVGKIFGMSDRAEDEVVWALSEKDGKELWATRLGPAVKQSWPQSKEGPSCTPTVDGERLYVEGMGGDLACLQVKDGKILWQRNLKNDFGGVVPTWSYRESPLVDGEKVICTPGGPEAIMVALDKLTGTTIWKSQLLDGAGDESGGPGGGSATVVSGTKDPGLFSSERWGKRAFSCKLPNGKYLAKLYFAENYEGITGAGQRIFSFNVQGHEFKDFDICAKAGGPKRAYIETVPVKVTDGELRIVFTPQVENPAINAIEITPQSEAATGVTSSTAAVRIKAGLSTPFTDSSGQVWQPDKGFEGGMMSQVAGGLGGGFGGQGGPRGGPGGSSAAAYASPIAIEFAGQHQCVQLTAKALIGVAASDGKFLWRYDRPANSMGINCTTPLYHDGRVFAASAYGAGGGLVKLSKDAKGIKAEEVWFSKSMENHHGGVVLVNGCLFGSNGGNGGGYLTCLDFKTGNVLWNERDSNKRRVRKGSMAFADDRIYYRTEEGDLILIEPSQNEYLERGRFVQPDRSKLPAWAHPAIANGKLYVRDQDMLLCYDVKARGR
jgi:alcohol dehydrogenase (cytochrome c)